MADEKPRGMKKGLTAYGDQGFSLFLRKAFIKAMGYTEDSLNRPIIGITNTFSGYNACHRNVPDLIEGIKRGVMLAGGIAGTSGRMRQTICSTQTDCQRRLEGSAPPSQAQTAAAATNA